MKRVVSVSLGSSSRNHSVITEILGETFLIERIGTDGDVHKLIGIIKKLDGKVSAFGMGGIDMYLQGPNKKYIIKDSIAIAKAAKITPILDGSILKNTLEKRVIKYINERIFSLKDKKVLMTSAVDRYGMALALNDAGANITFGDVMFGLNIPIPIRSFKSFNRIIKVLLPIIINMPFEMLYPTGKSQDITNIKYEKYYDEAEIIAGDYLFIKKHMPDSLKGKIIITNTITSYDIEELRKREVYMLITTTPEFNGRSFGTNVIEALITAVIGRRKETISYGEYEKVLDMLNFAPRILYLNKSICNEAN